MRKTRSEKYMLNNFLKEYGYRLYQTSSPVSNIAAHPLRNFPDVSIGGAGDGAPQRPWCSSLAPGLIRRYQVGCGLGVPIGGRNTGEQGPHPEENTLSSSAVGLCDWAWQLPGDR